MPRSAVRRADRRAVAGMVGLAVLATVGTLTMVSAGAGVLGAAPASIQLALGTGTSAWGRLPLLVPGAAAPEPHAVTAEHPSFAFARLPQFKPVATTSVVWSGVVAPIEVPNAVPALPALPSAPVAAPALVLPRSLQGVSGSSAVKAFGTATRTNRSAHVGAPAQAKSSKVARKSAKAAAATAKHEGHETRSQAWHRAR